MECQQRGVTRYRIAGCARWRGLQGEKTATAGRAGPELEAGGDLVHVQVARARLMRNSAAWRLRAMGLDSCASSLERHEGTWLSLHERDPATNRTTQGPNETEAEEKRMKPTTDAVIVDAAVKNSTQVRFFRLFLFLSCW